MFNWADYILPAMLLILLVLSLVKRVPVFDAFVEGAKEALGVVASVFPYLAAVFVCVVLFRQSGMEQALASFLSPIFGVLGIPTELAGMVLVKPLSGSGTTALLADILSTYGPDGYVGRCASVLANCGETVLYVGAVYFGTVKERKLGYGLPVALLSTLLGAIVSCWVCRLL